MGSDVRTLTGLRFSLSLGVGLEHNLNFMALFFQVLDTLVDPLLVLG